MLGHGCHLMEHAAGQGDSMLVQGVRRKRFAPLGGYLVRISLRFRVMRRR